MNNLFDIKEKYSISDEDFECILEEIKKAAIMDATNNGMILHEASKRDVNYCDITPMPANFTKVQMFAWEYINQFKLKK